MAAAVLRVLRPRASVTLPRSRARLWGTASGAGVAAGLGVASPHTRIGVTVVVLAVVVLAVAAMHLIGPRRYGPFTFCLTLVALDLTTVGEAPNARLALIRVVLTLGGTILASASILAYEKVAERCSRRR